MSNKLQEMYDGWKNLLIPEAKIKPYIDKISRNRNNICNTCEFNSKNDKTIHIRFDIHCKQCGCTLAAKTRSLTSSCPIGKWPSEVVEEKEEENGK